MQDISLVAEAAIPVSVFVKRGTGDFSMIPCVADDIADVGVSHQGTQDTQLPGAAAPFIAAAIGTSCKIYGNTKTCEILTGAAVAANQPLMPDANGKAIVATTGKNYSAWSNNSADAADQLISVTIQYGTVA